MLRTYSKNITVSANTAIPFNVDKIDVGSTIKHNNASSITVAKPGYYLVTLDASVVGTAAGLASIQLFADGVAIPDAIITETLAAGENENVSFTTIIRARPGAFNDDVALTVVPTVDMTLTSIALGIHKIA